MITEWKNQLLIIVKDVDLANQFYAMLAAFGTNTADRFSHNPDAAVQRYTQLNDGAIASQEPVVDAVALLVEAFNTEGYPTELLALAGSEAGVDALRAAIIVKIYSLYPDGVDRVEQHEALDSFITEQGYTRA